MNRRQLNTRLDRIEGRSPAHDQGHGTFDGTFEDLCRAIWRNDRAGYLRMAEEPGQYALRPWITQFETEDRNRLQMAR